MQGAPNSDKPRALADAISRLLFADALSFVDQQGLKATVYVLKVLLFASFLYGVGTLAATIGLLSLNDKE